MKIGVDYFSLNYATGGIKRFIIEFLDRISKADRNNDYEFIDFKNSAKKIYLANGKIKNINIVSPRTFRAFVTFVKFPKLDYFTEKKDLFIFLNFISYPVSKDIKKIVFVYDTSFLKFPEHVSSRNRYLLKKMVPYSIKKCDLVITISESVKRELTEAYNINPIKIKVLYMGIDNKFRQKKNLAAIKKAKQKVKISKNYFLYVSTIEPRKNINGIISAYEKLPTSIKNNYQLVLVGGKGWLDKDIKEKIENSKDRRNIILPGFVDDNYLIPLYSGAACFIYPSFYEGFGMPILEAMACGCPVITSNTSSMPEISGDAALFVDPNNINEIKEAMEEIVCNEEKRKDLVRKGFVNIKRFSWDKTFSQLADIINSVG